MDDLTARRYLDIGLTRLQQQRPQWERRQAYFEGRQDAPFAPDGVNAEYQSLQDQSIANWMGIAMSAPVQRMRADGFRRGGANGQVDLDTWNEVWQPNKLDARQSIVFLQMMIHGRGIWSVSRNPRNAARPIIRVENSKRVWIEPNPENPFESLFAVKTFTVESEAKVWSPGSATLHVAYVYDSAEWVRFERPGVEFVGGDWEIAGRGEHGLGEVPFVPSDANVDADGVPHSAIEPLMPQQDAINTIRFNTLLAMQFSAYRQRVFTGYDPVIRDDQGRPVWKLDGEGNPDLDKDGRQIPLLNTPGRIGVDRALVFPGADTKVFDLAESNLANYVLVYQDFLTTLFATGQIPPQYMLTRMANLSGDALAGAESTLQALVADLKTGAGESLEAVMRLANRARGADGGDDYSSEIVWGDAEARSFAQIVDAIVKLISSGFPRRAAFEMIPGATPPKVQGWMDQIESEADMSVVARALRTLEPSAPPDDPASLG